MPYCALGCAWIGEDEENLHCGPVSFQTPEEPVLEGSPLALSIYFNPKYEKKKASKNKYPATLGVSRSH